MRSLMHMWGNAQNKYMRNGLGSWFTFIPYPGMEQTNDLVEQTMGDSEVIRKIIETFH